MTVRTAYALPMTLAAIIVIAMTAAMAARQIQSSSQSVFSLSEQTRYQAELISAEQTLIYTLLTEPMGRSGVAIGGASSATALLTGRAEAGATAIIRANGRPYAMAKEKPIIVRLLDDASFLNLTPTNPETLSETLSLFDVPELQHSRFYATLQDYQDEDNVRRLGGAERNDYNKSELPPNRPLRDVREICSILAWRDSEVCSDTNRILLTSRARVGDHPLATFASTPLLALILNSTEQVQRTHERLETGEWTSFADFGAPELDRIRDPLSAAGVPGPTLILISQTMDARYVRRSAIELTPANAIAPFVVHSKYDIGGPYVENVLRIERVDDVAPFPEPSDNAFERR